MQHRPTSAPFVFTQKAMHVGSAAHSPPHAPTGSAVLPAGTTHRCLVACAPWGYAWAYRSCHVRVAAPVAGVTVYHHEDSCLRAVHVSRPSSTYLPLSHRVQHAAPPWPWVEYPAAQRRHIAAPGSAL